MNGPCSMLQNLEHQNMNTTTQNPGLAPGAAPGIGTMQLRVEENNHDNDDDVMEISVKSAVPAHVLSVTEQLYSLARRQRVAALAVNQTTSLAEKERRHRLTLENEYNELRIKIAQAHRFILNMKAEYSKLKEEHEILNRKLATARQPILATEESLALAQMDADKEHWNIVEVMRCLSNRMLSTLRIAKLSVIELTQCQQWSYADEKSLQRDSNIIRTNISSSDGVKESKYETPEAVNPPKLEDKMVTRIKLHISIDISFVFHDANKGSAACSQPSIVKNTLEEKDLCEAKLANEIYHKFLQQMNNRNLDFEDKEVKEMIFPWIEVSTNVSHDIGYIIECMQHLIRVNCEIIPLMRSKLENEWRAIINEVQSSQSKMSPIAKAKLATSQSEEILTCHKCGEPVCLLETYLHHFALAKRQLHLQAQFPVKEWEYSLKKVIKKHIAGNQPIVLE